MLQIEREREREVRDVKLIVYNVHPLQIIGCSLEHISQILQSLIRILSYINMTHKIFVALLGTSFICIYSR